MRLQIAALLFALLPATGYARPWYAITLNGNACEDMNQLAEESATFGQLPVGSPQGLIDALRLGGYTPRATTTNLTGSAVMVSISWLRRGELLERIFFSDSADCQLAVAAAIQHGVVPAPGALR